MLNFQFYNPTRIVFGKNSIQNLSTLIPKNARVLILYGGQSAVKYGTIDEVKSQLSDYEVFEFGGIEPNPLYETLMKAVELVKKHNIDFLLAVGGGSVIDGTKFISQAVLYPEDPWHILTKEGPEAIAAMPLGVVLTLPATGSEMNNRGVISKAATKEKLAILSDLVFPKFAILDPTKTYTLPKNQLANGLVDSFSHVLEQYMTYSVNAKVPDYFAEGVMKTIIEIAPDVMNKENDYDSRANFMWAATVALNGFLSTGVPGDWASHRISYELTALYGIDHARAVGMIIPALWRIRKEEKKEKLLQYAVRVWNITEGSDSEKIEQAINKTVEFFESLGLKMKISDYGGKKDIPLILERLKEHHFDALGERQDVTLEVSEKILERL